MAPEAFVKVEVDAIPPVSVVTAETVRVAVALPPIILVGIVIVSDAEKPSPASITVTAVIPLPPTVNSISQPTAPAP